MRSARLRLTLAPFLLAAVSYAPSVFAQQAPEPPPPPPPPPPAHGGGIELTTLRILHEKGILSDKEYESALHDMNDSIGAQASESSSVVMGKWATTLYGFAEADSIFDTTQGFADLAGATQVPRVSSYAGYHSRMQFGARNSRVGLRMKAPEVGGVRVSGTVEADFLGTQSLGYATGQVSESGYFTSPLLRIRHMYVKAETPVVDILFGQTWDLFGWQSAYAANTVEIQGVPGEVYSRNPQIRLSKTIKTAPVTVEVAVAAVRPIQRDSAVPDGEAGLRLAINGWTGMQTTGATGTSIQPASIAVTGDLKHVDIPMINSATPTGDVSKNATAGAVDVFLPLIPASKDKMGNSLSFNGEFSSGYGNANFYTNMTGGVSFATAPVGWPQDIDNGIVTYTSTGALNYIQWTSYMLGAQYYLPGLNGRAWISGNFSHMESSNTPTLATQLKLQTKWRGAEDWWDVNLFADVTPAMRLGLEYAQFIDHYVDGNSPMDQRVQFSGYFLF